MNARWAANYHESVELAHFTDTREMVLIAYDNETWPVLLCEEIVVQIADLFECCVRLGFLDKLIWIDSKKLRSIFIERRDISFLIN